MEEKTSAKDVDMDVPEAWKLAAEKKNNKREVVIAVIDTGIDYKHPDLADHMWVNKNEIPADGIDNDNNGYVDDIYGWDFYNNDSSVCHYKYNPEYETNLSNPEDNDDHGTHVAGIIGAVANNNIGIAGVASNIDVKIMSLKINGGTKGTGNISSAVEAIKYATMMGADICNMSWGTSQYTDALKQVMKESDMLFVAAAGNSGTNDDSTPVYPASLKLDNLISVTFINSEGKLTKYSNYGADTVDLAAPGDNILSTIVGSYATMSGSSMAAPQVTAIAAMIYAGSDNLYPSNIRSMILKNTKPLKNLEGYVKSPGIPSAYLLESSSDRLVMDAKPPQLSFKTIYNGNEMQIPVKALDQGGSGIRVLKWIIGERTMEDFQRGINGEAVNDSKINVSKAGYYTFYASDYAGNETVKTYQVKDDTTAPRITSSFKVDNSYKSRTITAAISDAQSGIRKVKYMTGTKSAADFLAANAGTEIKLKSGWGSFAVKKDGIYTIYASDNRGNSTVKQLQVKTVKATEIKFVQSKLTFKKGHQYIIAAYVKPLDTTDAITYSCSDRTVAKVTGSGLIKTLKSGKVYITVKTSSGKKAVCEITIQK
jgi:subtilisin family serine protease